MVNAEGLSMLAFAPRRPRPCFAKGEAAPRIAITLSKKRKYERRPCDPIFHGERHGLLRPRGVHGFRVLAFGEPRNDKRWSGSAAAAPKQIAVVRQASAPVIPGRRRRTRNPRTPTYQQRLAVTNATAFSVRAAFMGSGFSPSASPGMTSVGRVPQRPLPSR
jgi:hypothetical protein